MCSAARGLERHEQTELAHDRWVLVLHVPKPAASRDLLELRVGFSLANTQRNTMDL